MQREALGRVLRLLDGGWAVGSPLCPSAPSAIALVLGDAVKPTLPFNYRYKSSQQDDPVGRESKLLLEVSRLIEYDAGYGVDCTADTTTTTNLHLWCHTGDSWCAVSARIGAFAAETQFYAICIRRR